MNFIIQTFNSVFLYLEFIEKFAKRVKRVPEKCTQKCKSRIERFERTLRLKQISLDRRDLDRPCHSNQTQFY